MNRMTERETVVELPFLQLRTVRAKWKLRTVLPLTVGISDGAVQLVLTRRRVRLGTRGGAVR
jgi:hypothetical protein